MSSPVETTASQAISDSNRILAVFGRLRSEGRKGLMPFVCAGYPSNDGLVDQLVACAQGGASIVEIGFPFSDPIADGPVIAEAMHETLARGFTTDMVFEQVSDARSKHPELATLGLVAMVSMSIIHRLGGASRFAERAAAAGFDGLLVPDVPLDESDDVIAAAAHSGLTCTMLVAPTSDPERAKAIAQQSTGFVYMVARTGITGEQSEAPEVGSRVAQLRKVADTPIACGFGISSAEHVRLVVEHADAAIVGSALVRRLGNAADGTPEADTVRAFVEELAAGLVAPSPQDQSPQAGE
jgi:tryptophan synthase alpha chain